MNATDLLDVLAQRGARPLPPRSDSRRMVAVGPVEVAELERGTDAFMRARWRKRSARTNAPGVLIADDPECPGRVRVLGPVQDDGVIHSVSPSRLADMLGEAAGLSAFDAIRRIAGALIRLGGDGLVVNGLLTRHTLEHRLRADADRWDEAARHARDIRPGDDWRVVLSKLGYTLRQLPTRGYLTTHDGVVVAVVHPKKSDQDMTRVDGEGRPPEGLLVGDCCAQRAPFGILAHRGWLRLFDAGSPSAASRWLELDAALLEGDRLALLGLLAPPFLAQGGFSALKAEARDFGARLHRRLDRTIRQEALPALATGMQRWAGEAGVDITGDGEREELERAALTLVFRVVFILFCESAGHLPMLNPRYRKVSLSSLVREAWETRSTLSDRSTALWAGLERLFRAMRDGNPAWDMPAYNGSLFAETGFDGAEMLERMRLRDPEVARMLLAIGQGPEDDRGRGADFSTLEIGHIGHAYESLLSLKLSLAQRPVRYDAKRDRYVGATAGDAEVLQEGSLLWQTSQGGRKAGGVYYTPVELVRFLVEGSVLPAFERHLERVAGKLETDPEGAARDLFSFAVVDPACGSAHFLVQVAETLAERTARFLAEHPLPDVVNAMDRLRAEARFGDRVDDLALLRRLLVKQCVFGVDVSAMGVEVATLSLWLASFVPGLSLSYLGRNVVVGDSLIGVSDAADVLREATAFEDVVEGRLRRATELVRQVSEGQDRTPDEVQASRKADLEATRATAGLKRVLDLWTAEQFGLKGARNYAATQVERALDGQDTRDYLVRSAALSDRYRFLHWPLAFPHVFAPSRGGFDAVVGNPPWEEVKVEGLSFYGRWIPGLQSLGDADRSAAINQLLRERPELNSRLQEERKRSDRARSALAAAGYGSMAGDADLYKFFCRRYRHLLRDSGVLGVVLPRTAFNAKGSKGFRRWLYEEMATRRVDFLLNRRRWIFDIHPQYSVALVTARCARPESGHAVEISGPATMPEEWRRQASRPGIRLPPTAFGPGLETPILNSQDEADLLAKLRRRNRFPRGAGARWSCFPVRELHEAHDRCFWLGHREGLPLWKGASFGQYDPHGADGRSCPSTDALWKKVKKPMPGRGSLIAREVPLAERRQAVERELTRARIAFRDITNRTNTRTVIASLIPPGVLLTDAAPYLAFTEGDARARAACLGIMNSLPFDWQARRFVELHVSFFLLEGLHLPDLADEDFLAVARASARLSAVDDRYADFAREVGVEPGLVEPDHRRALRLEIDARVARSWGLTADDLEIICRDFTHEAVPPEYRQGLMRRLEELR